MLTKAFLESIPHAPGVYLMLDKSSGVLYVGKAKDLYKRLSSYVHFNGPHYSKTAVMLARVHKVDFLITNTEKEALILEASLIKKHRPKYNVILRDDKSYPMVKVTLQEEWPRVQMTRRKRRDGARYFGPYSSSSAMWSTLKIITKLFPLRRCKGSELRKRKRPCLNYQMNQCLAPCAGKADPTEYQDMVKKVVLFLEGKNKHLLQTLKKEMQDAAIDLDFEKAAQLRDQIQALTRTLEKQVVISHDGKDQDVFGLFRQSVSVAIVMLHIRKGVIGGSREFFLADSYGDDSAILSQVVKQIYDDRNPSPPLLLLPTRIEDQDLLAERLSDLAHKKVQISVPMRGGRLDLIRMAQLNAEQLFEEREKKNQSWNDLARVLMKKLHLSTSPESIECFDISNISGTSAVGSLVRFAAGEPDKAGYRHYKINGVQGPDDYAMMREVLTRRLEKARAQGNYPDLLIVDGGRGQLNIAVAVTKDLGVESAFELIGIAKARQGGSEKLYRPGRKNPILLPAHDPALLFIMRIRDESHRFGITFHRSLRRKKTLRSRLDQIPGVGTKKKQRLLTEFGSLKNIGNASPAELQGVEGIGPELAAAIHTFFRHK